MSCEKEITFFLNFVNRVLDAVTRRGTVWATVRLEDPTQCRWVEVAVPVEDGRAIAWLYSHGEVLDRADSEEAVQLRVRLAAADKARFERMTAE